MHRELLSAALVLLPALPVFASTFYVAQGPQTPVPPYSSWSTAATHIQNAVDLAVDGDTVLVSNGVYHTGGRIDAMGMSNRVHVGKAITLIGVGAERPSIVGAGPVGASAVRCIYLASGATLSGFTLTNGFTRNAGSEENKYGGGAFCAPSALVTHCLVTHNVSYRYGGGVYGGTISDTEMVHNQSNTDSGYGGAAAYSQLVSCTLSNNQARGGGGLYNGIATNCLIIANTAFGYGGGAHQMTGDNCELLNNRASVGGGGAYEGILRRCMIEGNQVPGGYGGGVHQVMISDSIIRSNVGYYGGGAAQRSMQNCLIEGNRGYDGGGVYTAAATNCTIRGNTASNNGGGVYSGSARNSFIHGNRAESRGGGSYSTTLHNCTLTGNSAVSATGMQYGFAYNSIIYYNGTNSWETDLAGFIRCCLRGPSGFITNSPALAGMGNPHITALSPCRDMGSNVYANVSDFDIDGEPRMDDGWVDIGCDEYVPGGATGAVTIACIITPAPAQMGQPIQFQSMIDGRVERFEWWFDDGLVVTNLAMAERSFSEGGWHQVTLKAWNRSGESSAVFPFYVTPKTKYVSVSGLHQHPYTNWVMAATNIQSAVNAALPGERVLVSNGVYATGGAVISGMTARVVLTNSILLQSVNGPAVTTIAGQGPCGPTAVRGIWCGPTATVSGFTITNGHTLTSGDALNARSGGGIWGRGSYITNCIITGNEANYRGGGVYGDSGTIVADSRLIGNRAASEGGGIWDGRLYRSHLLHNRSEHSGGGAARTDMESCFVYGNHAATNGGGGDIVNLLHCTVVSNSAGFSGGGISYSAASNSIVYYNRAGAQPNYDDDSTILYTCTTPKPSGPNYTNEPGLLALNNPHLTSNAFCIGRAWQAYAAGVHADIDRDARILGMADIGADEYAPGTITGALSVAILASHTEISVHEPLTLLAVIDGKGTRTEWNMGDGTVIADRPIFSHSYASFGTRDVVLKVWNESESVAATSTVTVTPPTRYASLSSRHVSPFTSWEDAATNIQAAVDVSSNGFLVLVAPGLYRHGGRTYLNHTLTNRVMVPQAITVRGAGPQLTVIEGQRIAGQPHRSVRGVYLANGARLENLKVTGGATYNEQYILGGGVLINEGCVVSNCVIEKNWAAIGGGVYSLGLIQNSIIHSNTAEQGGGVYGGTVSNCWVEENVGYRYGGGMHSAQVVGCTILYNHSSNGAAAAHSYLNACTSMFNNADLNGGAYYGGTAEACRVERNYARFGAGAYNTRMTGCEIVLNSASVDGGGLWNAAASNCMISWNYAVEKAGGAWDGSLASCTVEVNYAKSGGGVHNGSHRRTHFRRNVADDLGGGAVSSTLYACEFISNRAGTNGGAAAHSHLYNCTVVSNTAKSGGGTYYGSAINTIYADNHASAGSNYFAGSISYSCAYPLHGGIGNIAANPRFLNSSASDFRLASDSPCIDTGTNNYMIAVDFNGIPVPLDGNQNGIRRQDMGAHEYVNPLSDSDGDGLLDTQEIFFVKTDPRNPDCDEDGVSDWAEVEADTNPWDATDYLRILAVHSTPGFNVQFNCSTARVYRLQVSTQLTSGVWADVPGASPRPGTPGGVGQITDTNVSRGALYRINVSRP